jgi:hypothetical protein
MTKEKIMKKTSILAITILSSIVGFGQGTFDFEDFNLKTDSFVNDFGVNNGFERGFYFFNNNFDQQWKSWDGFALSSMTDTITNDWTNQYSSVTGSGVNNSKTYVVTYPNYVSNKSTAISSSQNSWIYSFSYTNSAWAYLYMKSDSTHKYSGQTGNDPDYLKLLVIVNNTDTFSTYLADYRFTDNSKDYILMEWKTFNLKDSLIEKYQDFRQIDTLDFALETSDSFTPTYVCLDNFITDLGSSITESKTINLNVFPNPTTNFISIDLSEFKNSKISILNINGKTVVTQNQTKEIEKIDLYYLPKGVYFIEIKDDENTYFEKVIKK